MFYHGAAGSHQADHSDDSARAVALLPEMAAALRAITVADFDDDSLCELITEFETLRAVVDACEAHALDAWDAHMVWAGDGARSGAAWMASHTTASRPAAAAQIKCGRALRSMPLSSAAFDLGQVGSAQIRLLVEARRQAPDQFAAHEEMLVGFAKELRVDEFARALAHWLAYANPDGAADRAATRHAERSVSLHPGFDGMWDLQGRLGADAGEALREVFDTLTKSMYRSDKALADAEHDPALQRTAAQRRHDALEEVAKGHRLSGEAGGGLNVPAVTAVVRADAVSDADSDEVTHPWSPVGETANGVVLSRVTAQRLLCDCSLSRVVMGPGSTPINLGVSARLPSPAQRRALAVRYRGCAFPGCDCPPGWTSAHHIVHWVNGGPTDLDNLVPLCSFHHHRVHEGGFGVERLPEGDLRFTRPNGSRLSVPKGRSPDPTDGPPLAGGPP